MHRELLWRQHRTRYVVYKVFIAQKYILHIHMKALYIYIYIDIDMYTDASVSIPSLASFVWQQCLSLTTCFIQRPCRASERWTISNSGGSKLWLRCLSRRWRKVNVSKCEHSFGGMVLKVVLGFYFWFKVSCRSGRPFLCSVFSCSRSEDWNLLLAGPCQVVSPYWFLWGMSQEEECFK